MDILTKVTTTVAITDMTHILIMNLDTIHTMKYIMDTTKAIEITDMIMIRTV